MTRIFLSYSSSDSEIADRVVAVLRRRGAEHIYDFRSLEQRGGQILREIADAVERADVFVILLSAKAMGSPFCQSEQDMAVHRQIKERRRLIYWYKIDTVTRRGFTRLWDCMDLLPPVSDDKLTEALRVIPIAAEAGGMTDAQSPALDAVDDRAPEGPFRNRQHELAAVLDAVSTPGGHDLWVVTAPPKLGKTWFLDRLRQDFTGDREKVTTTVVDLHTQRLDDRVDATALLCSMFDVPFDEADRGDAVKEVARALLRSDRHHLAIVDSADLLLGDTVADLRILLAKVDDKIAEGGRPNARISVVIGSRRHADWTGLICRGISVPDFHVKQLSEFENSIIRDILSEEGRNFESGLLRRWTEALRRLSAGLPALLVRSLDWARVGEFLDLGESDTDAVFNQVVRPYVKRELLSMHALFDGAGDHLVARYEVILEALESMTVYRIVTSSHLRHHLQADEDFAAALEAASWSVEDLWEAIGRTALVTGDSNIWQTIFPPLRTVLYRHFHPLDDPRRADHHATARRLYEELADNGVTGTDRVRVLLELIWHEAMSIHCTDPDDLAARLPDATIDVTRRVNRPDAYGPAVGATEFQSLVRRQLNDDKEFVALTQPHEGLFSTVVTTVCQTIAGGT